MQVFHTDLFRSGCSENASHEKQRTMLAGRDGECVGGEILELGLRPAYLVEFSKIDQVTWFCTKLGQVTWICKIVGQITWAVRFAQGQITWYLEFEGQVTWICKAVDQVTWETKREDQITSTTILQKWTRLPGGPDYLVAAKSGPDCLVAVSWAEGDGLW